MADITMCTGENCCLKSECFRNTCIPNEHRQSYFDTPPITPDGNCNYFISNQR